MLDSYTTVNWHHQNQPMKRTRLSPEARRDQILDSARRLVVDNGLQQFSLKHLAVEAGVSEPLLFHYFASRTELLQQLLSRDFNRSIDSLNDKLDGASTLEEILSIYVTQGYERHGEERVLDILLAEPEIAAVVEPRRTSNAREREQIFVDKLARTLGISRRKSAMIALMATAANHAAAAFAHEHNVSKKETVDTVIKFVRAGFKSQQQKK